MSRKVVDVQTGQSISAQGLPKSPDALPRVPYEVTMRQARMLLLSQGHLATVEAAIDALPDPPRAAARIEWEYSNTVQRNNAFVSMLGAALGWTSEQLDEFFIAGAQL